MLQTRGDSAYEDEDHDGNGDEVDLRTRVRALVIWCGQLEHAPKEHRSQGCGSDARPRRAHLGDSIRIIRRQPMLRICQKRAVTVQKHRRAGHGGRRATLASLLASRSFSLGVSLNAQDTAGLSLQAPLPCPLGLLPRCTADVESQTIMEAPLGATVAVATVVQPLD